MCRSCGRDRRWSPSLTSVTCTSAPPRRSARRSAVSHGTSGSRWPCSRRTGQASGDGRAQHEVVAAVLDQRAGDRGRVSVVAGHEEHAVAVQGRAFGGRHGVPHQGLGEVGRGGDADQRAHVGPAAPAPAAARSSRPWRSRPARAGPVAWARSPDGRPRVQRPTVPSVKAPPLRPCRSVQAEASACRVAAPGVDVQRLAACHVAAEAPQEHHRRAAAGRVRLGQASAVGAG